jgi:hypothetical protein
MRYFLRKALGRIGCILFGCWIDYNECPICKAELYDGKRYFIEKGKLSPLIYWFYNLFVYGLIPHKCDVCKKLIWFQRSPVHNGKCAEEWIPF